MRRVDIIGILALLAALVSFTLATRFGPSIGGVPGFVAYVSFMAALMADTLWGGLDGRAGLPFWSGVIAAWLSAWWLVERTVIAARRRGPWGALANLAIPLIFG